MSNRRIDTVVRVRRIQEQLASGGVARSRQELTEATDAEQAAWRLVGDTATAATAPMPATQLVVWRDRLDGRVRDATRRGDVTAQAAHHADVALIEWREAMQRLDGIERLSERVAAADRAESERAAGVELDDLVVMRWERA
jgi:hypothetical protein